MSPVKEKLNYSAINIASVSKEELLKALKKVEESNKQIDKKSKFTNEKLSVRVGT